MILYVPLCLVFLITTVLCECDYVDSQKAKATLEEEFNPVVASYSYQLPESCPLDVRKDMLAEFERRKVQMSVNRWKCEFYKCGKVFLSEHFLHAHFMRKHADALPSEGQCLAKLWPMLSFWSDEPIDISNYNPDGAMKIETRFKRLHSFCEVYLFCLCLLFKFHNLLLIYYYGICCCIVAFLIFLIEYSGEMLSS
eukprot:TRINITY_DN4092_c0_g2_i2.p1 TRINITY_DN4092_c0_g2~~TRINITY_DN4092_c0_g2_i2.p1  ORF type:complete len:196 (-),score=12.26 TRINITY_DN4092_c0_g2_i2:341-928(-)